MRTARLIPLLLLAACTAAGGAAPRDPAPLEVREIRGTGRYRIVTDGLEPEIAVEGLRAEDVPYARTLLDATQAALDEGPQRGAVVTLELGPARVRVQLVSAASDALLVVDVPPTGASVHPVAALAAVALARAWDAHRDGDFDAARRLALDSVRLHPGDPLEAGVDAEAPGANRQNHLAWALLAQLSDGAERERWYVGALERSSTYLAAQLGAPPEALLAPERDHLFGRARAIVAENLAAMRTPAAPAGADGPVEIRSPIRTGDERKVLLPAPFLQLYARNPGAALLQDDAWVGLAVDAFERLRADPVELLLATREVRSLYLDDEFLHPAPPPAEPVDKMLSALLADVARNGAAGLTEAEVAATLGAEAGPEILGGARRKLAAQREREAGWYAEALRTAGR